MIATPDEQPTGQIFTVRRGKHVLGTYHIKSQAEAIAHAKCGWVNC